MNYLPKDVEFVVAVDIAQLRSGPLAQLIKDQIKYDDTYEEAERDCGFDPLDRIDRVVMGGAGKANKHGVIVIKGRDSKQLLDCIGKLDHSTKTGDVLVLSTDDTAFIAPNATTIVGVYGDHVTADAARDAVKHQGGLLNDPAFQSLYQTIDTHRAFWFAAQGAVLESADLEPVPRSITASIGIASKIAFDARIRFQSAADATSAIARYGDEITSKVGVGTATVKQEGADVALSFSLTAGASRDLVESLSTGW